MKILEVNEKTRRQVRGILSQRDTGRYTDQEAVVQDILARVREEGDRALFDYTERFDHITLTPETAEVTEQEIAAAYDQVPESLLEVIRSAHASIRQFHEKQRINSWFTTTEDGTFLGQKVSPLSRAGVYVPGGKAAYPSSVLMNIVPARVAGVGEIIMTTQVGKQGSISPAVLVAAREAGVDTFVPKPLFAGTVLDEFREAFKRKNEALVDRRAELMGRRILLAEDVAVNAEIMVMVLSMREIEVDVAVNGRIAVEMFESHPEGYYDAILMDMRMPEMDGLEATKAIRAMGRSDARAIPIIALTANAFDEDVQRSMQAGLDAHLSKPVEPDALFRTLEELIRT